MNVAGKPYRSVWLDRERPGLVRIIDQRLLPHRHGRRIDLEHVALQHERLQAGRTFYRPSR